MKIGDEYEEKVRLEAKCILLHLTKIARIKGYETDIFIRHVLNEINKMYKLEVEE